VPAALNRKRSGHPVFRHSREGGKPVVRGILVSRLRGNDEVGNRISRLIRFGLRRFRIRQTEWVGDGGGVSGVEGC
jgi:hypothetical protein